MEVVRKGSVWVSGGPVLQVRGNGGAKTLQ